MVFLIINLAETPLDAQKCLTKVIVKIVIPNSQGVGLINY
jgi:hypothetical protein